MVQLGCRGPPTYQGLLVRKKIAWGKIYEATGTSLHSPALASTSSPTPAPVSAVSELASYLDSDTITCFDDDFDILSWWHEHKLTYPILSILAKDVMYVPVSTVSSESCFSLTGRVIEERRRRLAPHNVEYLTCIKDWEAADARAQHDVEKLTRDLELKFGIKDNAEGQTAGNESVPANG